MAETPKADFSAAKEQIKSTLDVLENVGDLVKKEFEAKRRFAFMISDFKKQNLDTPAGKMAVAQLSDRFHKNFFEPIFVKYGDILAKNGGQFNTEIRKQFDEDMEQTFTMIEGILNAYSNIQGELTPEAVGLLLESKRLNEIQRYLDNEGGHYGAIVEAILTNNTEDDKKLTKENALRDLQADIYEKASGIDKFKGDDLQAVSGIINLMEKSEKRDFLENLYGKFFEESSNTKETNKNFATFLKDMNYWGALGAGEMAYYIQLTNDEELISEFDENKEKFGQNWKKHNHMTKFVKEIQRKAGYGTHNAASQLFQPKNILSLLMFAQSAITITANVGVGIFNSENKTAGQFVKNLPKNLIKSTVGNSSFWGATGMAVAAKAMGDWGEPEEVEFTADKAQERLNGYLNEGKNSWDSYDQHFGNEDGFGVQSFAKFLRENCIQNQTLQKTLITPEAYQKFLAKNANNSNQSDEDQTKYKEDLKSFQDNKESFLAAKEFSKIGEMIFELDIANQQNYRETKQKVLLG